MAFRSSLGPTLFADPQNQVVASAHHSDLGDESPAMRTMPGSFMVFTNRETTKDRRADSVYKCFAHTGSDKTGHPGGVSLLGVCSDTTPYSKSKHSRVGVTVSGAVPIVIDRNDLKGLHPGDLLDYRFEMAPVEFDGLPKDFRTARVKPRGSYIGPIMSPASVHVLRAILELNPNKKAIVEEILKSLGNSYTLDRVYNAIGRHQPKSDDSIDWLRDALGPAFFGPTNFDHWWSLHKVETDSAGKTVCKVRHNKVMPYAGWLCDFLTPGDRNITLTPIDKKETNEQYWSKQADLSSRLVEGSSMRITKFLPYSPGKFKELDEMGILCDFLRCDQFDDSPPLPSGLKLLLAGVVCDGKCGPLGKLVEVSGHSDEAVVLLETPTPAKSKMFDPYVAAPAAPATPSAPPAPTPTPSGPAPTPSGPAPPSGTTSAVSGIFDQSQWRNLLTKTVGGAVAIGGAVAGAALYYANQQQFEGNPEGAHVTNLTDSLDAHIEEQRPRMNVTYFDDDLDEGPPVIDIDVPLD